MGEFAYPVSASAAGVTVPAGVRIAEIVQPEVGAGSLSVAESPPVVSPIPGGLAPRIRPSALYADGGFLYFVCFGNPWGFQVADISDPAAPVIVGEIFGAVSLLPYKVRARTDLGLAWLCTNSNRAIRRYDVSNPAAPVQTGNRNCGNQPFGFDVNEDASVIAAATTSGATGLRFLDQPSMGIIGSLIDGTAYADVAVEGDYAYASAFVPGEMRVVDISDPTSPVLRGGVGGLTSAVRRIVVRNRVVYLLCRDQGPQGGLMYVFDCRDPDNPVLANTINCPNTGDESNIEFNGNLLLTSRWAGGAAGRQLRIWSLADPLKPELIRLVEYAGSDYVYGLAAAGDYCYIGNRQFGPNNRVFTVKLR